MNFWRVGLLALALAALASLAAQAQTYTPTTLTASQILAKASAARGTIEPGAYRRVEVWKGGGLITTQTTDESGSDYVERDVTGPVTTYSGSYKSQAWDRDANGIVTLESSFRSKSDPNDLAWDHPDDPKYNVHVLGETSGAEQQYVIEANPPGGSDQYAYYDAQTFHLVKFVTFAKDRYRHVVTYSDFRTVYGETRWFHYAYSDGRPQNDTTGDVTAFEPEKAVPNLTIPVSGSLFPVLTKPLVLPARFTAGGIVVRITINGRGLDLALDSGAGQTILDPGVANQLGIRAYGRSTQTIGGNFDTSLAVVPQIDLGPLHLSDVAIDIGPIDLSDGDTKVVGLLGYDFLASGIIGIDFKQQTVTVYPRGTFAPAALGLKPMHVLLDDRVPRVPAAMEGVSGWFLMDTGSFASIVYPNYLNKLRAQLVDADYGSIEVAGGYVPVSVYAIAGLSFGPIRFDRAQILSPRTSTFDLTDYDGILGRDVLSDYAIYFDYSQGTVYLKPNPVQ